VSAIDEINVGMAGRSEEHRVARCMAGSSVGRGIVLYEVSLDFHDACHQTYFALADQDLAKKVASDASRTASEENAMERVDRGWCCVARSRVHASDILSAERRVRPAKENFSVRSIYRGSLKFTVTCVWISTGEPSSR
jgi:hypothetical protein